jgi:hypothetical protein
VRHVRMLGLCLVAVLALGAYAVSSASALEWGKCEFVGSGGNYTGPNCKAHAEGEEEAEKAKPKGTGEYEWRKASEVAEQRGEGTVLHVPFTGAGGEGVLSTALRACESEEGNAGSTTTRQGCEEKSGEGYHELVYEGEVPGVVCEAEHAVGTTSGKNKVENIKVSFEGCEYFAGGLCTSSGAANEGEVDTALLKGKLGWITKSPKVVGVVLEPATSHAPFANFLCGGFAEFTVGVGNKKEGTWYTSSGCGGECPGATPEEEKHGGYNQVISPITPINKMTNAFTQVYTRAAEAPFGNVPHALYNKHISALETKPGLPALPEIEFDWAASSEEITNVNTPEEEGEIKA